MGNNSRDKLRYAMLSDMSLDLETYNGMVDYCKSSGVPIARGAHSDQKGQHLGPARSKGVLPFYMSDAETCPPYGVLLMNDSFGVHGTFPYGVPTARTPNTFGCHYNALVNGPTQITGPDFGFAQIGDILIVAYDHTTGTPAVGDSWGPRTGSPLICADTGGFTIMKILDSTNHYAIVHRHPMTSFIGKNGGSTLAVNHTGSIRILNQGPTGLNDSGVDMPNVTCVFGSLPANAKVFCQLYDYYRSGTQDSWLALVPDMCP